MPAIQCQLSYIKYNNAASLAKGLNDASGKTVSGSLKTNGTAN